MDENIKTSIWNQFGAAIDMLEHGMRICPDEFWSSALWDDPTDDPKYTQFWFLAYHTLSWLDLYLSDSTYEDFKPPAPFIRGVLPDKPYSKDQLFDYLEYSRKKCQATIAALTDDKARQIRKYKWVELSFLELLFYTMRHVQEHAAQLQMLLGQNGVSGPDWIAKAAASEAG